jgi:prephenate dehydratase/prephenate dehydrogenase
MKIGYLGPPGSYSEEVARRLSPGLALQVYPSIDALFEAVASQAVTQGVTPLESVVEGPVTETLDNLFQHAGRANIHDVIILPVQYALGSAVARKEIHRILSTAQAFRQCAGYLGREFPEAELIEVSSAISAIEQITGKGLRNGATIAPESVLERYGLKVIEANIGDVKHNKLKFALLGAHFHEPTGSDATSLVIYPHRDRIGLLEDILHIISQDYGLNLSSIHSRPDTKGGFRFYIELEGHLEDEGVAGCIGELERKLEADEAEVKVFGAYPRRQFNEPRIRVIGIIGGTGLMGSWFVKFFGAAGYRVLTSGRKTPLTYRQCIEQSDAVIINVPIQHTVEVIEAVGKCFRPGQLIVDNASIKTRPVAAMLKSVPEGVEVLGMHTVFGPSIAALANQNVLFTPTPRSGELAQEFEGIFYKHGARITRTSPEHHDQQMAFHQNLEHFTKIALAEVMRRRFGGPQALASYSSPNSRMSLITLGRILNLDPQMIAEIQTFNTQGPAMVGEYLEVVTRLGNALIQGEVGELKESMTESARRFGEDFLGQMMWTSREIEDYLRELNRAFKKRREPRKPSMDQIREDQGL